MIRTDNRGTPWALYMTAVGSDGFPPFARKFVGNLETSRGKAYRPVGFTPFAREFVEIPTVLHGNALRFVQYCRRILPIGTSSVGGHGSVVGISWQLPIVLTGSVEFPPFPQELVGHPEGNHGPRGNCIRISCVPMGAHCSHGSR